jgi:pyrroline-5-carboxylate reductase
MPNTPAMVGCGATGLFASATVTQAQKLLAETIFANTGFTAWLKTEEQLHAVTAASGSAPAYFFYLYEAMIDAAVNQGLPEPLARELVIQTGFGAAELAKQSKDHPAQLRARVTSPKGTTEQAILSFTNDGLPAMVSRAMQACHERSEAMSQELESE